jgi:predicted LPLAT superfamily acyltransferase
MVTRARPILLSGLLALPAPSPVVALREGPGRYEVFVEVLAERVQLPAGAWRRAT